MAEYKKIYKKSSNGTIYLFSMEKSEIIDGEKKITEVPVDINNYLYVEFLQWSSNSNNQTIDVLKKD